MVEEKKTFKNRTKIIIIIIVLAFFTAASATYFVHRIITVEHEKQILKSLDTIELHYDANGPFILVDAETGISGVYNGRYRIASSRLDESVLNILEINKTKNIPYMIVNIE